MKITIEIPDTTLVLTYQYVFDDEKSPNLSIKQNVLDSNALKEIREAKENDPHA